jgi:hypothetical protein
LHNTSLILIPLILNEFPQRSIEKNTGYEPMTHKIIEMALKHWKNVEHHLQ